MSDFQRLPPEIFQHICNFLDVRYVLRLGATCKQFRDYINDSAHWKGRLTSRFPYDYPPLPDDILDWKRDCVQLEEAHRLWSGYNMEDVLQFVQVSHGISQAVDAVHIRPPGNLIFVGGRDRYFTVFRKSDLLDNTDSPKHLFQDFQTHQGWIWTISSRKNVVLTGSWDCFSRIWTVGNCSIENISKFRSVTSVLCSKFLGSHVFAVGTYGKFVNLFDTRTDGTRPMQRLQFHTRPVLGIDARQITGEVLQDQEESSVYLFSTSEDKKLAMWDMRQANAPVSFHVLDNFARLIHGVDNELWAVDKTGMFHLLDTRFGLLQLVKSTRIQGVDWGKGLGAFHANRGCMFAATLIGTVQSLHPVRSPLIMGPPLIEGITGGVSALSFHNNCLAAGTCSGKLLYWSAKQQGTEMDRTPLVQFESHDGELELENYLSEFGGEHRDYYADFVERRGAGEENPRYFPYMRCSLA